MPRALLTRFRVKPEPEDDPRYYQVLIYSDKPSMYAGWTRWRGKWGLDRGVASDPPAFEAITHSFAGIRIDKDGTETDSPCIGFLCFHLNCFGAGIVSHEMTHAALFWLHRLHIPLAQLDEDVALAERFCLAQGQMVRDFWSKWFAAEKRRARMA